MLGEYRWPEVSVWDRAESAIDALAFRYDWWWTREVDAAERAR